MKSTKDLKHGERGPTTVVDKELSALEISSAVAVVPKDVFLPVESTLGVSSSTSLSVVQSSDLDKQNNSYMMINEDKSPPISVQLRELANNFRLMSSSTSTRLKIPVSNAYGLVSSDAMEPQTQTMERSLRVYDEQDVVNPTTPWETLIERITSLKKSLVKDFLRFLNTAGKEEITKLKGIGEKRATSIIELRTESPEPFKSLDDLAEIGLSIKQIKGLMKREVGE